MARTQLDLLSDTSDENDINIMFGDVASSEDDPDDEFENESHDVSSCHHSIAFLSNQALNHLNQEVTSIYAR